MKKTSTVLTYSLLALFAWSLTLTGCGEKSDGADAADSARAAAEESSEAVGDIGEKLENVMIEISKDMISITEDIESVEDAEKAEPRIAESMEKLSAVLVEFSDNVDKMTMEDMAKLQHLQNLGESPEAKEWMDKAQAATDKLKAEHPDAAAKLEELGRKHSQKTMEGMMALMMKVQQKASAMQAPQSAPPIEGDAHADSAGH